MQGDADVDENQDHLKSPAGVLIVVTVLRVGFKGRVPVLEEANIGEESHGEADEVSDEQRALEFAKLGVVVASDKDVVENSVDPLSSVGHACLDEGGVYFVRAFDVTRYFCPNISKACERTSFRFFGHFAPCEHALPARPSWWTHDCMLQARKLKDSCKESCPSETYPVRLARIRKRASRFHMVY